MNESSRSSHQASKAGLSGIFAGFRHSREQSGSSISLLPPVLTSLNNDFEHFRPGKLNPPTFTRDPISKNTAIGKKTRTYPEIFAPYFERYPDQLRLSERLVSAGALSGLTALEGVKTFQKDTSLSPPTKDGTDDTFVLHGVRHAESEFNRATDPDNHNRYFDITQSDGSTKRYDMTEPADQLEFSHKTPLSPKGRNQTAGLSRKIPGPPFHVVLSTRPRTLQTCTRALGVEEIKYDDKTQSSGRFVLPDDTEVSWSMTPLADEFDDFYGDNTDQTNNFSEYLKTLAELGKKTIMHFGHGGVIATLGYRLQNEHALKRQALEHGGSSLESVNSAIRTVDCPDNAEIWTFVLKLTDPIEDEVSVAE